MLLQARLEQTEATLQKLIGQMGVLTASLAGAGLVVGNSAKEVDVTHEHCEEVDSDDEDEEEEDEENSNAEDEEEESEDEIEEDNEEDESEDESD